MFHDISPAEKALPQGFRWGTAEAAIKRAGRLDVGIIVADNDCNCAAVFTQNAFSAAPVEVSREILQASGGRVRGVVVNSGCANAATGSEGLANAREMAQLAAGSANAEAGFLVCSTGTIGVQLPMERVRKGIADAAAQAGATPDAAMGFARAIMTTDTVPKIAHAEVSLFGRKVRLVGCAKGAGMIHPQMATLLAFVTTDAAIAPDLLDHLFRRCIDKSLNCLTVDGDTSTNDTAIILASGKSGVELRTDTPELASFESALLDVLQSLAKQLARDGEGATKLVEISITGGRSFEHARKVGLAIGVSPLVKTAIYGRDANWGRIVCAAGNADPSIEPARVSVRLGELLLFDAGAPLPLDEEAALEVLSRELVRIEVGLGAGDATATVWTCDLTEKYIEINGAYRT
jgi:glutamate N-acetyltransferase / amino-acid N-acetyltransferase